MTDVLLGVGISMGGLLLIFLYCLALEIWWKPKL